MQVIEDVEDSDGVMGDNTESNSLLKPMSQQCKNDCEIISTNYQCITLPINSSIVIDLPIENRFSSLTTTMEVQTSEIPKTTRVQNRGTR